MKLQGLVALAAACVAGSTASASVVSIASGGYGLEGNGAFTGTIEYTPGTLVITLTNDQSSAAGGRITGLAFNISGDATATLSLASHPFADLGTGVSAPPFGSFDAGAAMGGTWSGGGSPSAGIAVGQTGTFTFNVTGPGAAGLTALSFIGSSPSIDFAVRFRGFTNGGSDKTPGFLVPAPATLALLGVGAIVGRRRR